MKKLWKIFKAHTSEFVVAFSLFITLGFTITCIILSVYSLSVSDVLIEWVFKFYGLELLALSGIKISKRIGSAFGKAEEAIDGTLTEEDEREDEENDR